MFLSTGQPTYLFCAESSGVRVVCPYVERAVDGQVDIATPYGFSGFVGNGVIPRLSEHWRSFAESRGYVCAFLSLHPLFALTREIEAKSVSELKEIYVLDTTKDISLLLAACDRSRRRSLRHWQSNVCLYTHRPQLKTFLMANYADFFARKQANSEYRFSRSAMEFLLDQENVQMIGAGSDSALEAVNVFALSPYGAEGLFNVCHSEGRHHGTGLIWEALLQVQRRQIPFFNLGGGLVRGDPLAQFKSRFGANSCLAYAVRQVLDAARYRKLCKEHGADPQSRDGYFPPYRADGGRNISGV